MATMCIARLILQLDTANADVLSCWAAKLYWSTLLKSQSPDPHASQIISSLVMCSILAIFSSRVLCDCTYEDLAFDGLKLSGKIENSRIESVPQQSLLQGFKTWLGWRCLFCGGDVEKLTLFTCGPLFYSVLRISLSILSCTNVGVNARIHFGMSRDQLDGVFVLELNKRCWPFPRKYLRIVAGVLYNVK